MCHREIKAHVPERFWYIHVTYKAPDGAGCDFVWDRGHLFERDAAITLYEACVEESEATIRKVRLSFGSICTMSRSNDMIKPSEGM